MFWSYMIGFTTLSVGIYFFLALIGSEILAQIVLFLVGIAALAGLAAALEQLKRQGDALARLEEKLDRLQARPEDRTESGGEEHDIGNE